MQISLTQFADEVNFLRDGVTVAAAAAAAVEVSATRMCSQFGDIKLKVLADTKRYPARKRFRVVARSAHGWEIKVWRYLDRL